MDPTANLKEQLELAKLIIEPGFYFPDSQEAIEAERNAERLAELVLALHGWISNHGFLPSQWRKP